jgi:hypothetical protein
MLGVVPPAYHTAAGFLVGEAMSYRRCSVSGKIADAFTAFLRRIGERGCYECTEALTVQEFKAIEIDPAGIVVVGTDNVKPKPG